MVRRKSIGKDTGRGLGEIRPADFLVRGTAISVSTCWYGRLHFVFLWRFDTEQMLNKIIPTTPDHIRFVPETVSAVWQHDEVEILVGLNQFIDDEEGIVRRHIGVQGTVGK